MRKNPIPTDALMRALGSVPDDTILVVNALGNLVILDTSLEQLVGYVDIGPGRVEVWVGGTNKPIYREDHGTPSQEEFWRSWGIWGDPDA